MALRVAVMFTAKVAAAAAVAIAAGTATAAAAGVGRLGYADMKLIHSGGAAWCDEVV